MTENNEEAYIDIEPSELEEKPAVQEPVDEPRRPFRGKEDNAGFLVAKGRFHTPSSKAVDSLLRQGVSFNDVRVQALQVKADAEIKAAEKEHVKHLANAVFMAMYKHGDCTVRTVGARAAYNANKAIAIAAGLCATKGIEPCFTIAFDEGDIGGMRGEGHVAQVTALKFSLKGYKDWWKGERK